MAVLPLVTRVGHSEGSKWVYVKQTNKQLLPLKSHCRQRKSARGASDRAFPPNTESFPIPQGLPALSRTPGTPDQCRKERTTAHLSHMWVAHLNQEHEGMSLKTPEYYWVCQLSRKRSELVPRGPRGADRQKCVLTNTTCRHNQRRSPCTVWD